VHADGGVVANVLAPLDLGDYRALAARLRGAGASAAAPVTVRVWTVLNLWTHAPPTTLDPARRAAMDRRNGGLLFYAQPQQLVARLADLARLVTDDVPGLRVEFRYTAVPAERSTEPGADRLFDAAWMRRLEGVGYARAERRAVGHDAVGVRAPAPGRSAGDVHAGA